MSMPWQIKFRGGGDFEFLLNVALCPRVLSDFGGSHTQRQTSATSAGETKLSFLQQIASCRIESKAVVE